MFIRCDSAAFHERKKIAESSSFPLGIMYIKLSGIDRNQRENFLLFELKQRFFHIWSLNPIFYYIYLFYCITYQ